ncbi:MAG: adenylate kinase [Candidatus Woesearchaeota archaeon]
MKIIILGPPGAGKGTVGQMISEKDKIPIISTGDLFRQAIDKKTELGAKAKGFMDKGLLVPDEIVMQMVSERLKQKDCKKGFILDGIPRTIPQAEALERNKIKIDAVLNFHASKDIIIDRLSTRLTCRHCGAIFNIKNVPPKQPGICDRCGGELYQRDDQKPEVIMERIRVYGEQTAPLIGFYQSKHLIRDVDADPKDPKKIFENALEALYIS